jgi:hypothetical protein
MMLIENINEAITQAALEESIQDLIRDMQKTQHGDRSNRFYDVLGDTHIEGGVWKHTKLGVAALPEAAEQLGPDYVAVYNRNLHLLRAAALYHDVGKLVTKKPAKNREGVFIYPGHDARQAIQSVLAKYEITVTNELLELITQHHVSEKDIPALRRSGFTDEQLKMLVILKTADLVATGPRGVASAVGQLARFRDAVGVAEPETPPLIDSWDIDDVKWKSQEGFSKVDTTPGGHIAKADELSGEAQLVVVVTAPHYKGKFRTDFLAYLRANPGYNKRIKEFVNDDIMSFLSEQPDFPDPDVEGTNLSFSVNKEASYKVTSESNPLTFEIIVDVEWDRETAASMDANQEADYGRDE